GGVGGSAAILDADHITLNGTRLDGSMSDVVFAYQAFAGLRFKISESMGVSVEYRYFAADSPSWKPDVTIGTDTDHVRFGGTQTRQYKFREVPYARFAAEKEKTNLVFYESGKLVVQGKGTQEFIEFVLEPEILKEARLGYEAILNPELLLPRLGVDESGKGDFFGPLCIAGAYVNESVVKSWADCGIRDSKNISSDKRIKELAEVIRKTPGCVTTVVPIGNEAYNRLYAKMRSVNTLLAWGHARVIENLMGQRHRMSPPPVRAISDQFASDKATVAKALMSLGREIELVQKHRAESDIAVAAA